MIEQKLSVRSIGSLLASSQLAAVFGAVVSIVAEPGWQTLSQMKIAVSFFALLGLFHCVVLGLPMLAISRTLMVWSLRNLCVLGALTLGPVEIHRALMTAEQR